MPKKPHPVVKVMSARFAEIDLPEGRIEEAVRRLMNGDILVRQRFAEPTLNRTGWCHPKQSLADLLRMISIDPRSHE